MSVHLLRLVSDFLVYFYDDGLSFENWDDFRASATVVILTGRARSVEIHLLHGDLRDGDTDELALKLKAAGFWHVRAEVRKDIKVSRLLTLVEEKEFTNIYYADLREF